MEDNQFWVKIWTLVACVMVVLIICCTLDRTIYKVSLSQSSDPVAFACANSDNSHSQPCAVVMARSAHK